MSNPEISIIIGSFNQKTVLERVLGGFNRQILQGVRFEVIVVDSSSTDGTIDYLKQLKPNFHFRAIVQENRGKAAARNRGVAEARSPFILITDSDMIPDPLLVKVHLERQKKMQKPTCFEGLTYDMTQLHWPPEKKKLKPYIKKEYKSGGNLGWYYFLTGNISFPKSIFDAQQGFDEAFGGYGWEDLELGYRFSKEKIPLCYLDEAINYHYHVISKDEDIDRHLKKGESAQYFLKKHPELKLFLGLNPMSTFIRKHCSQNGIIYQLMKKCYASKNTSLHELGHYFLKEWQYLTGVLGLK